MLRININNKKSIFFFFFFFFNNSLYTNISISITLILIIVTFKGIRVHKFARIYFVNTRTLSSYVFLFLSIFEFIAGTASLDPKSNGKISMVAILYVISSNTIGVLVGLIMYFIVKPGTC